MRKLKPDLGIVVSYGVILKPELLNAARSSAC
jgi:methionyl-tRNA formyltransferase